MSVQEFKGHVGIGPEVTGIALAASDDFKSGFCSAGASSYPREL